MEKLYNYLLKIGVEERPKHHHDNPPAVFYREQYGDPDYFRNAPNFIYPGAVVALDYNAEAPQEYFKTLREIEKKLETYCSRYAYRYTRRPCYGVVFYTIHRAADVETADSYYRFRDAARREFEQYFHIATERGETSAEIEATAAAIMDKYGAAYSEFLAATA